MTSGLVGGDCEGVVMKELARKVAEKLAPPPILSPHHALSPPLVDNPEVIDTTSEDDGSSGGSGGRSRVVYGMVEGA